MGKSKLANKFKPGLIGPGPQAFGGEKSFLNGIALDSLRNTSPILTLSGVGAVKIPLGTEAERPTGANGLLRYNSTSNNFEGYSGSGWVNIGGASSLATSTASGLVAPRRGTYSPLTITSPDQTIDFVVTDARAIYYQCQSGTHRMFFSFWAEYLAGTSDDTLEISGISLNVQGVQGLHITAFTTAGAALFAQAYGPYGASNAIRLRAGSDIGEVFVSGDVQLSAKPSWA